ncbi:hypothetical protein QJS66_15025 [Kocuria rhizophila]|nr:hypothetical protein QJS66_15025 [Kocuria rhizophila]
MLTGAREAWAAARARRVTVGRAPAARAVRKEPVQAARCWRSVNPLRVPARALGPTRPSSPETGGAPTSYEQTDMSSAMEFSTPPDPGGLVGSWRATDGDADAQNPEGGRTSVPAWPCSSRRSGLWPACRAVWPRTCPASSWAR